MSHGILPPGIPIPRCHPRQRQPSGPEAADGWEASNGIPCLTSASSIVLRLPRRYALPAAPLLLPTWYLPFPGCSTRAHWKLIPQDTNGDAGVRIAVHIQHLWDGWRALNPPSGQEDIAENSPVHHLARTATHSPADGQTDPEDLHPGSTDTFPNAAHHHLTWGPSPPQTKGRDNLHSPSPPS